jgi:hypothetical protein
MYDWEGAIDRIDDPDSLAELLGEVTLNISKNYIPNEEKTFRPGDPPWLTKNCKNAYRKYSRYYKRKEGFHEPKKLELTHCKRNMLIWSALRKVFICKGLARRSLTPGQAQKILDSHEKTIK